MSLRLDVFASLCLSVSLHVAAALRLCASPRLWVSVRVSLWLWLCPCPRLSVCLLFGVLLLAFYTLGLRDTNRKTIHFRAPPLGMRTREQIPLPGLGQERFQVWSKQWRDDYLKSKLSHHLAYLKYPMCVGLASFRSVTFEKTVSIQQVSQTHMGCW